MAKLIDLNTIFDDRGILTVIEKSLPFQINRVFYIYGVDNSIRGKHRHKETIQAAICINGSCRISNNDGKTNVDYTLDSKSKCLILFPEDYHTMSDFSKDAVLLVLASHHYDPNDYIYEPY
jgi:hypothetical protein